MTLLPISPCRWAAAHHQAKAVVPVWRAGREVRLGTRRRRPLHPLPSAHAGDGAREEGHGRRMPQPPLDQLVATITDQTPSSSGTPTVSLSIVPLVAACGTTAWRDAGDHLSWSRWERLILLSWPIPHIHSFLYLSRRKSHTSPSSFPKGM